MTVSDTQSRGGSEPVGGPGVGPPLPARPAVNPWLVVLALGLADLAQLIV